MMKRQDFRFFHRLRVRWAEVDMQKIVFNAHYLMYFDTAVTDYWRALALPYESALRQLGGDLYVKKATVEYHASAHHDDRLDVGIRCARIGNSSLQFIGAIYRGASLLISAELVYVFADPATQSSRPVPQALRNILNGFEAGEGLTQLQTGGWAEMQPLAAPLRTDVFVREQGVPADLEWDGDDAGALHAVLCNRLGQGVATARLLPAQAGVARIGRMAVHQVLRGSGLGSTLLLALLDLARRRGDVQVLLHAQRDAESFYRRHGFTPRGEPFDEAGIEHIEMTQAL